MANKGEWSEPYVALRILGEGKLYLADDLGNRNLTEWMDILALIRHETRQRIVQYRYQDNNVDIAVYVNDEYCLSVPALDFLTMADELEKEIRQSKGRTFNVTNLITDFLSKVEMHHIKAASINKSDVFLSIRDPRAGVVRNRIGFSIKSDLGKDPTLFNTAKASAFIYKLTNMNDVLMNDINAMVDRKGHVAVQDRCERLLNSGCNPVFHDFPIADRAKCKAFKENLDLIDPRLIVAMERLLWKHFFERVGEVDFSPLINMLVDNNPCELSRPEVKYPFMFKSFLYAAYCGMTASTLWNGNSQVNGGLIKVTGTGDVVAYYALESDSFKTYLLNNCYLEFPDTDYSHGNYGYVYKEDGEYYFRLNFQIRYR